MKPESVEIRGRVLQTCSHGECQANRIWNFPTCWRHLTAAERQRLRERLASALRSRENLKGIVLTGADLQRFDFTGTDLTDSFLNDCNLEECKFVETNLVRAFLGGANLKGADLTRAELHGTVFTGAHLEGVDLTAYSLSFGRVPINLHMRSFGEDRVLQRPRIDESEPYFAEATYRGLKRYFLADGDYDSASWAAYCERLMQRKNHWNDKNYLRWALSLLFSAVCGYGEKPGRVFLSALAIVLSYAAAYHLLNTTPQDSSWGTVLYFSAATFCGFSFSDLLPRTGSASRLLVASESFWGIFILGLFVFTLTKRHVAR